MRKYIFVFVALANLLNAGESGKFIGGSLSLGNTSYSGVHSILENNITTDYPHSNRSHNTLGYCLQGGFINLALMSDLAGDSIGKYVRVMRYIETKMVQNVEWTLITIL